MANRTSCPSCDSKRFKYNGLTHNGKQNHKCKKCGRQFVNEPENKVIPDSTKELIMKALLERTQLRGICRIFDVSLTWLLDFITLLYADLPGDLNFRPMGNINGILCQTVEADEMWSFVGNKKNKQWIWIAMDANTRQIIAVYVGDRSKDSARELWNEIPERYRNEASFYTDLYDSYVGVIPEDQHHPVPKESGKTNHIERFNCTVRQRVSRLVRKSLSFSKKLQNHIGAIKYFLCHYNITIQKELGALHV